MPRDTHRYLIESTSQCLHVKTMLAANTYSITIYSRRIYPGILITMINQDQLSNSKCRKGTISTRLNSPGLKDTSVHISTMINSLVLKDKQSNEIATQAISQPGLTPWF